jgi:hypothetical protein
MNTSMALRACRVARDTVYYWRKDSTGHVYVQTDVIMHAIDAAIYWLRPTRRRRWVGSGFGDL